MKKLWVLFLALFAVFGIVSCNNDDPTEIEYNLNEQLEVPANLSVNESTKTLTWDAVENAIRYNVYIDGELETEVTTTSFDFSSISGDKLMFTVKAMAPTGMQNSNVSTTIAYVANRASEISQMKLSIQARDMGVSDEDAFATELVSKGMLSEDFDSMMDDMDDMESIGDMTDVSDIYDELDQLLSTMDMDMVEALISSIIKVELKAMIQSELDMWSDAEFYSDEMQQLEDLLQFIEDEGDQAVKSAMIVIEYLVDIQNGIDTELVTSMETIVDSEELTSANISALVSVKNDLVTNFKENLPELQDVIVLNSTLVAFAEVMTEGMDTSIVSIPKQSAQSLMSMELFFNFILEMDETYVGAFVDAGNALSPVDTKPFVKENIKLMNQYLENNDVLIQQLNNIYTDAEKEDLFYDYYTEVLMSSFYNMMGMYTNLDATFDETIIEEQLDFDNIMLLQASMGETFNEILDAIVESDYAVIDAIYDVVELQETTQSQMTEVEAVMNIMEEVIAIVNPILQDTTLEEYNAMIDLIFGQITIQLEMQKQLHYNDISYRDMTDVIAYIETGVKNTAENQLNIFKNMSDLLAENDYFNDLLAVIGDDNIVEYGTEEYWGTFILLANVYLDFYTDSQNDIDAIIDEMITVLSEPVVRDGLDLRTTDVEDLETAINSYFTDLTAQANLVKDYDNTNLTTTQEENLDAFVTAMFGVFYSTMVIR